MKRFYQKYIAALLLVFLTYLLAGRFLPALTATASDIDARLQLEQQLQNIEAQIIELEQQLTSTKGEKNTLANKIKQLKNEQAGLRLQIKATNVKLNDLDKKISVTVKTIETNQAKITRLKTDLAKLLRLLYQKDQELLLLRLFIDGGISQLFTDRQLNCITGNILETGIIQPDG